MYIKTYLNALGQDLEGFRCHKGHGNQKPEQNKTRLEHSHGMGQQQRLIKISKHPEAF